MNATGWRRRARHPSRRQGHPSPASAGTRRAPCARVRRSRRSSTIGPVPGGRLSSARATVGTSGFSCRADQIRAVTPDGPGGIRSARESRRIWARTALPPDERRWGRPRGDHGPGSRWILASRYRSPTCTCYPFRFPLPLPSRLQTQSPIAHRIANRHSSNRQSCYPVPMFPLDRRRVWRPCSGRSSWGCRGAAAPGRRPGPRAARRLSGRRLSR